MDDFELSLKFISSSYSKDLSIDHNVMARRLIESEWYQMQWGDRFEITSDQNTKGKFDNTAGGFRTCTSTGGTITGKGGDIVIVDDPINPKQSLSDRKRTDANHFFDQTLRSRLDDPDTGIYIVVMQRLHEEDLTGHLLKNDPGEWAHICIPAEISEDVKPTTLRAKYVSGLMFATRFNKVFLAKMAKGLQSYGYACQYLQRAAPEQGGIIKKVWFRRFNLLDIEQKAEEDETSLVWNFKIDGAFTSKEENDATAIIAYAWQHHRLYVRDVISVWMELPDLIKYIPEFCQRNGYTRSSMVKIEPKGPGLSAAQTLERYTDLNVMTDKSPTVDKMARAKGITPFLESGRCYLLKGGRFIDHFLHQVGSFPNAKNDDELDVLIMAVDDVEDPKDAVSAWGVL